MKKSLIAVALLTGCAFAGMANAYDGTINFIGNITDAACTVTANTANQTVTLGKVQSTALPSVGATAAPTLFSIVLANCPAAVTGAYIKFDGPADTLNSKLLALTSGTGVATGVAIGLYEQDSSTQIPVGGSANPHGITPPDATYNFIAKYVATKAAVTAGPANAVTNFTIIYN
ncbi:fimbrial protein [Pseudomonas sp. ADAK2]|uniref:fimbrial protein n=1 Tax=unclassified Pseudomonas TaxID=196821 RepID=UPI0014647502|nr:MULTISPECIES: fimbrial protein [unclassified Pseudomonas]QJI40171.1 fimbrial protein [Pseudomonas sp. ADAK7]QJI46476.1 fimbrial protein [Pseudomonas sp. ADAK2]